MIPLDRRTGGLEIYAVHCRHDRILDRRTGGLENVAQIVLSANAP